jgi:hypothetical protein
MSGDEINRVIRDIEISGLPCEIETTIKFSSSGWFVTNQSSYLDEDTNELRHIDLTASKPLKPEHVEINLIVECSKSDKPWAFYGIEQEKNTIPQVCPSYYPKTHKMGLPTVCCSHQGKKGFFEGRIPY